MDNEIRNDLTKGEGQWLDEHFKNIERKILEEARNLARIDGREKIEPKDIPQAALKYSPGVRYPDDPSFWERFLSSISGVTLISAILAIAFGILGAATGKDSYYDIVKIFAGAIVGSTSTGVISTIRRK